ncbi:MAG: dicarboxylate/amino acid:cation symporter [Neisseriaceae bacterium]
MKIKFGTQCLLALFLGLVFGYFVPASAVWYLSPIATIFLKLLKLMVVPLVFSTIVASFAKSENYATMKKLSINTLWWFLITAVFASLIGIIVASFMQIGVNLDLHNVSSTIVKTRPSIREVLLDMLPGNIIADIANGKIIPVILFAIFIGLSLASMGGQGKTVKLFFDEFSQILFKITRVIIRLSPIAIFVLMAQVSNEYGIQTLLPLVKFILAIYIACALQLIVYMLLIMFVARINPLVFLKAFGPAMVTAFTTSSSLGTLPVTIECLIDNLKIHKDVAGFVAPLGANMKMDACGAIYPAIVCILTANILHIDLSMQQYLLIFILSTIAAFCSVGMPSTALMSATFVVVGMGFPLEGLALVIGIDKIVDMGRTMTNVTGTGVCTLLVDKTMDKRLLS